MLKLFYLLSKATMDPFFISAVVENTTDGIIIHILTSNASFKSIYVFMYFMTQYQYL